MSAVPDDDWAEPEMPQQEGRFESLASEPDPESKGDGRPVITLAAFSSAELMGPIEPEKYLIPGMVPTEAYTLLAGALSAAKTTLLHCLMLWRATGYDVLDLSGVDGSGVDVGPCVLVSYEDSDNRIIRRFQRLAQHQHAAISLIHGKGAATEYLERIEQNFRRVTLTGQMGAGIVYRNDGAIYENTPQVDAILKAVGQYSSSGVMFGLDPLRLAIVGSQNDDDGADTVVHVLNRMANHFPDSGLIVPSHTTKSQAKGEGNGGMADASYATSGSALYSQHARSNFHLARLSSDQMRNDFSFGTFTDDEITKQLATCLTHGRLSHGAESGQKFFAMRGGVLEGVAKAGSAQPFGDSAAPQLAAISDALDRIRVANMKPSRAALEQDPTLKQSMRRTALRDFLSLAIDQGWVSESAKTKGNEIALTDTGNILAAKAGEKGRF